LVAFSYSDVPHTDVMHKASLAMAEGAGKHVLRKTLPVGVISHNLIVEGLTGKPDLVFGGDQLFTELHHILAGL